MSIPEGHVLVTFGADPPTDRPVPGSWEIVDLGDGTFAAWLGGKYYRVDADLPTKAADSEELTYANFAAAAYGIAHPIVASPPETV